MRIQVPDQPALIVPKRYERPIAPLAFVVATDDWGRKSGRTVTWRWSREMGCWTLNLSLPATAPVMQDYQEGRLRQAEPPTEGIPLMEQDESGKWHALDLEQYGPTGIVRLLEEADMWSGRGKHRSLVEFVREVAERNRRNRQAVRARQRNWARDLAADVRRQIFKIPFHRVGIDLTQNTGAAK